MLSFFYETLIESEIYEKTPTLSNKTSEIVYQEKKDLSIITAKNQFKPHASPTKNKALINLTLSARGREGR